MWTVPIFSDVFANINVNDFPYQFTWPSGKTVSCWGKQAGDTQSVSSACSSHTVRVRTATRTRTLSNLGWPPRPAWWEQCPNQSSHCHTSGSGTHLQPTERHVFEQGWWLPWRSAPSPPPWCRQTHPTPPPSPDCWFVRKDWGPGMMIVLLTPYSTDNGWPWYLGVQILLLSRPFLSCMRKHRFCSKNYPIFIEKITTNLYSVFSKQNSSQTMAGNHKMSYMTRKLLIPALSLEHDQTPTEMNWTCLFWSFEPAKPEPETLPPVPRSSGSTLSKFQNSINWFWSG